MNIRETAWFYTQFHISVAVSLLYKAHNIFSNFFFNSMSKYPNMNINEK